MTMGPAYIKDLRERIIKKKDNFRCDDQGIVKILDGHLQQIYDRLINQGLQSGLELLFRMMIFSEHFDIV